MAEDSATIGAWNGRGPIPAWLDPRVVTRQYLRRSAWEKLRFAAAGLVPPGPVQGGSWDRRAMPCEAHPTYRLLAELHAAGLQPERTALYQRLLAAAEAGRPISRRGMVLDDEAAIDRFFAAYVDLVERMREEGYRPGASKDEPGVAVARDGEIIKVANGNHRFAVARLLGLAPIPVEVHFLHPRWHAATPRGPDRLQRSIERAIAVSTEHAPGALS